MNWGDLAKTAGPLIAQSAPTIGGILGSLSGIPGGSMIGSELGSLLANAFGVPNTPDAVNNAIQNDPNAADKLASANAAAEAKWPALAQMYAAQMKANSDESESINSTMRAELAAGQSWWSWRNMYGYSVGVEATATSWVILYAIVFAPDIFKHVSDSLSFFLSWYGMRFGLLGYIHNASSNEKIAAVTGEAPSLIKSISKAVRGK